MTWRKVRRTSLRRIQRYQHNYCLLSLTGCLGCRWKRYQQSKKSYTPCDHVWSVMLLLTFCVCSLFLFHWLAAANDQAQLNYVLFSWLHYWVNWYYVVRAVTYALFTYLSFLMIEMAGRRGEDLGLGPDSDQEESDASDSAHSDQDSRDPEQIKSSIVDILDDWHDCPFTHAVGKMDKSIPPPNLVIDGFGYLSLPVNGVVAKELVKYMERSPYGHGEQTITDLSYRNSFQISPGSKSGTKTSRMR